MKRLLLVTHRPINQAGGSVARWRAFARYLPEFGWEVDVLSAAEGTGANEFDARHSWAVARRAHVMAWAGRRSEPLFRRAGLRPDSLPLSMLWIPRGALLVRQRLRRLPADVLLATGPPFAGPIAARVAAGTSAPLIVELRDLWAGSPAFDAGGQLLGDIEEWLLRKASRVVACTPEAVSDLHSRHSQLDGKVVEITNGFDPEIRSIAGSVARVSTAESNRRGRTLTILHSGTLNSTRPVSALVRALNDPRIAGSFRLLLHGYLSPASRAEVEQAMRNGETEIEMLAPSSWREAVARIASADACLIVQDHAAGDETAVAGKVYEYLALGKPVLCVTAGGATEALLQRLGADALCARLGTPETIVAALLRLREHPPRPVPTEQLERYSRRALAGRMAELLEEVANGRKASSRSWPASVSAIRSAA